MSNGDIGYPQTGDPADDVTRKLAAGVQNIGGGVTREDLAGGGTQFTAPGGTARATAAPGYGTMTQEQAAGMPTEGPRGAPALGDPWARAGADVYRTALAHLTAAGDDPYKQALAAQRGQAMTTQFEGARAAAMKEQEQYLRLKQEQAATDYAERDLATKPTSREQQTDMAIPGMKPTVHVGAKGETTRTFTPLAHEDALIEEIMRTRGVGREEADKILRQTRTDITTAGQEKVRRTWAEAMANARLQTNPQARERLTNLRAASEALDNLAKMAPQGRLPGSQWARTAPTQAALVARGLDPQAAKVFETEFRGWLSNPETIGPAVEMYRSLIGTTIEELNKQFSIPQAGGSELAPIPEQHRATATARGAKSGDTVTVGGVKYRF